jgi:hypothetical protein
MWSGETRRCGVNAVATSRDRLLTPGEVAQWLGVSAGWVRDLETATATGFYRYRQRKAERSIEPN